SADAAALAESVGEWPAFPDSPQALIGLKRKFKLAIISNIDDELFAASNRHLGVEFDWIVTAQQARSYKPATNNFRVAFERIGLCSSWRSSFSRLRITCCSSDSRRTSRAGMSTCTLRTPSTGDRAPVIARSQCSHEISGTLRTVVAINREPRDVLEIMTK